MKRLLQILFILMLLAFGVGYYFKYSENHVIGERIIGLTVMGGAFIFMPLFIYERYKGKNLSKYTLFKDKNAEKDTKN